MKRLLSAAALLASVCAAHGAVTLFDFEDEAERATVPCRFAHDRTICVTNALATSGEHALYFRSGPWSKGLDRWPSFDLHTSVRDWRGYDRLVIDLVSAGEGGGHPRHLHLCPRRAERPQRHHHSSVTWLPPVGRSASQLAEEL